MPYLPLVVTVGSSPPDLVTRVAVSADYVLAGQLVAAGHQLFDAAGGVLVGEVRSDPLGAFPDKVRVVVSVDYAPGTGLTGFTKPFEVRPADAGAHLRFDVPRQLDRKVRVSFGFVINPKDQLTVRWDHLVDGAVVRGDSLVVTSAGASPPVATPAEVVVELKAQPEADNKLQVRVAAVTTLQGLQLEPFSQAFPVDAQYVVLKSAPGSNGALKIVAASA